jgi:hypothetical protein
LVLAQAWKIRFVSVISNRTKGQTSAGKLQKGSLELFFYHQEAITASFLISERGPESHRFHSSSAIYGRLRMFSCTSMPYPTRRVLDIVNPV